MLKNSNDDIRDTSPSLPTAGHKALHSNRCVSTYQNDVASPSAAGHSNQQLVARLNHFLTNATADSATISAVNTKKFTNTCRFLVNPRTRASAASRYLFKRYY
ncbi:DNA polymerase alpha subunit B [Dorcoceras hygrometricum]|uniref:DNA polymerase alpha subunit B n=1 Tax=Dorcoceras hygrometricum TaxID=472368 RepID=A0A2Z7BY00_9LAMI|nr:DNA polymerase alpha subunit B [Dorcoceras hygrometricum]